MPNSGAFSPPGKDGENFKRLFEECLRQSGLSPRSLHRQLLRDRKLDVPEKTIASWRTSHSTTGRVVVPKQDTVRQVAELLCARDDVSVTQDALAAWQADKAVQAARRSARLSDRSGEELTAPLPHGIVTLVSARFSPSRSRDRPEPLGDIVTRYGGVPVVVADNEFLAAFAQARDALSAAASAQAEGPFGLETSIGIHTGQVALTSTGYAGLAVHHVRRMSAAAHPGQVVVSEVTADLLGPHVPADRRLVDLGEARLRDLSGPQHFFELRNPEWEGAFPPLKSLEAYPHNLPLQVTSFIGRVEQIEQLRAALSACRLCTLTGIGGSGKTRLALQLAAELIEDFADGVWVVDLASTPEPQLLAQAVASALGVREGGTGTYTAGKARSRRPAVERVAEHLRLRHALVVLDNCEHLVEPCAVLVDLLLRTCPDLKVLCTSRERLGVEGELEYRVPPLAVPPQGKSLADEELGAFESVLLFLDRAAHRRPELRFSSADLRAVGDICRRVEGLALAVELAAARVRMLSPRQILELLDDRLGLLDSGSPTAPARHQTLRSMIDWSHDDLSPRQRTLLRRLSVFVGSFELAAVQHVCSGDGLERFEILDLLGMLVDKSLVETDHHAGVTRYRLLETIRSYADDKLAQCGEQAEFRVRHRDWYLALAEHAEAGLTGAEQCQWLDRLELDHDNLRAALEHDAGSDDTESALRLASALGHFWLVRGFLTEARQHLHRALERAGPARTTLRAKATAVAGHLALFDSDLDAAARLSDEALEVSAEVGYRRGEAWALRTLGRVASAREEFDEGRRRQDAALSISRELSDAWGTAFSLTNVGNLEVLAGRFAEAGAHYEESLVIRREIDDAWGLVWSLLRLGVLRTWQGRFDDARSLLEEALELSGRLRYGAGAVLTLLRLGESAHLVGDQEAAQAHFMEARARAHDLEDQTAASLSLVGLAEVAVASGDHASARRWLGVEEGERSAGTRSTYAAWLHAEVRLTHACGEHRRAIELLRQVLALRRHLGDVPAMTEALEGLGVLYVAVGEPGRAGTLLAAAASSRATMGAPVPPLYRDAVESAGARVPGPVCRTTLVQAVADELSVP